MEITSYSGEDSLPLISIIIPHKNSCFTAERLLASIPEDDWIEVVLVDDNSRKEDFDFISKIRKKNLIISRNDSGINNAGQARNIGLSIASGKWIVFADADDEFSIDGVEVIKQEVQARPDLSVICFLCEGRKEEGGESSRADFYNRLIAEYPSNKENILYHWVVPWGKAIKSTFIKNNALIFDSCIASNDVGFATRLASANPAFYSVNRLVYYCYESEGSLTASIDEEKALSRLLVLAERNIVISKNKVKIKKDYGFTFFCKSKPWRLDAKKLRIYCRWMQSHFHRVLK